MKTRQIREILKANGQILHTGNTKTQTGTTAIATKTVKNKSRKMIFAKSRDINTL